MLIPSRLWYFDDPDRYHAFRTKTEATSFLFGCGLPGRVVSSRKAAWVPDVTIDSNFPRAQVALEHGLHAGFAFAVWTGEEVAAVLEFFSRQTLVEDANTLSIMEHIATQLSRVVERENAAAKINYLAYHDTLTGLPNRRLFKDRMDISLDQALRFDRQLAVLFLDLDRFKVVNDSLGHKAGDELLHLVSTRLLQCVKQGETVARWAGDEFVILMPEVSGPDEVREGADLIIESMRSPFFICNQDVFVTFSLGAAVLSEGGSSAESLLRNADTAVYKAKQLGRNRYEIFPATWLYSRKSGSR